MQNFLTIHCFKNITCLYQCPFLWPFLAYITVLKNRWNWKKVFCFISNAVLHKFLRTLKVKNFACIKRTTLTHQNTSIFISQEGGGNRYFFSEGYGLLTVLEQATSVYKPAHSCRNPLHLPHPALRTCSCSSELSHNKQIMFESHKIEAEKERLETASLIGF